MGEGRALAQQSKPGEIKFGTNINALFGLIDSRDAINGGAAAPNRSFADVAVNRLRSIKKCESDAS